MSSMLMSSGLESDAQMMRLFEVTVHSHPLFVADTEAGKRIHTFVTTNYGLLGREIIRKLMEYSADELKLIIEAHRIEFMQKYQCKFVGSERFWEQTIILADLIGKLAIEWGLIRFDYTKCTETVVRQLGMVRKNVQDNATDTFDLITEYLNDNSDTSVTAMHTSGSKVYVDTTRLPRSDVRIRYDLFRKTHSDPFEKGVVLLDRAHFKRWLATNGADIRNVLQDIVAAGVDATPNIKKAYLAKDTSIKLGQTYVVGINLKHPRLEGILTDKDDAVIEADLAGLTIIKGGKAD